MHIPTCGDTLIDASSPCCQKFWGQAAEQTHPGASTDSQPAVRSAVWEASVAEGSVAQGTGASTHAFCWLLDNNRNLTVLGRVGLKEAFGAVEEFHAWGGDSRFSWQSFVEQTSPKNKQASFVIGE